MPARFLLIDGYNLLHAAGMARQEYGPGDLQRCRERLLRYLTTKLKPAEIARATVIFDARDPPPGRPSQQVFRNLTVLFANPDGDADVVIQQWLDDHSAPKRVTLVSSDHALQRAARRRRSAFVDSETFVEQLERRRPRTGRHDDTDTKPPDGLSAAETDHWLRFFGDLSAIVTPDLDESREAPTSVTPSQQHGEKGKSPGSTRKKRTVKRKEGVEHRGRVATDDPTYWMQIFGQIPEAQELGRGKSIPQADLERWLEEADSSED